MKSKSVTYAILIFTLILAGLTGYYVGRWYDSFSMSGSRQYVIVVSTTTSLYQIGVLDDLFRDFSDTTHLNVRFNVLVRGSGEALRLLADGSACIGFVHAPSLELQYVSQGVIERLAIFGYNEFILVGPREDPANVSGASNITEAFRRIFGAGEGGLVRFVSRGDMSGTHVRELQLWKLAGLNPDGKSWYLRSGQGMTQTLLMAENLDAYTLTDVGTYLRLVENGKLGKIVILVRDPLYLINVYSIYLSRASSCDNPYTWYVAYKFRDYLMSKGQELLASKYEELINPVKGNETLISQAWEKLTRLG